MNRRDLLRIGLLVVFSVLVAAEPLSGQSNRPQLRDISDSFASGSGSSWIFLFFFVFLVALAIGLVYFDLHLRRRSKVGIDNPHYLLTELIRAHELTRVEKQFLTDFADESNLTDPLPLFIEPKYFLSALDDDRFQESHRMIEYLLKKLFDIEHGGFTSSKVPQEKLYSGGTTVFRSPEKSDKR